MHDLPLQLPAASHVQDGSLVGHAHVGGAGGTLVPVDGSGDVMFGAPPVDVPLPVVVVPPALQPQPEQLT